MKKIITSTLMLMAIVTGLKAQHIYPTQGLGDSGYDVVHISPSQIEYTGSTFGYQPNCNNYQMSFNFTYPSRELDPVNAQKFTLMKYQVLEQNWITGLTSVIYSQPWAFDPGALMPSTPVIQHNMAANGEHFTVKPFHLYYLYITTRKGKQNFFGNVVPVTFSLPNSGHTETIIFGACANKCITYGPHILGNLPSSAANLLAGIYDPLYETDHYIESTTHLNTNEKLIFDAGDYVKLKPGFRSDYGSDFIAYIDGCGGRQFKIANPTQKPTVISEVKENSLEVNIYPNPNSGDFRVDLSALDGNTVFRVEVFNMVGVLVSSQEVNTSYASIDISDRPEGVYLVRITSNGKSIVKKVVIQ
jgi:hypothetical protein